MATRTRAPTPTAPVTAGTLGPRAVAELRAIAQQRAAARRQLDEFLASLARKETMILAVAAEGQGCDHDGPFAYDPDADPPAWRVADEGVRVELAPPADAGA